jgi:uncharacterized protein YjeT (DUF2065 family)
MSGSFLTAIGLVFVIEGLTYALVPGQLKKMMASLQSLSDEQLRIAGTAALAAGVIVIGVARLVMSS